MTVAARLVDISTVPAVLIEKCALLARYVAKRLGLAGKDGFEQAEVDMYAEQ